MNETEFPSELPNPTSLALELSNPPANQSLPAVQKSQIPYVNIEITDSLGLNEVLGILSERLAIRFDMIGSRLTQLHEDYQSVLYRRDMPSNFRRPQNEFIHSGTIEKVDELGRLVIRWKNGDMGVYHHREVEYCILE